MIKSILIFLYDGNYSAIKKHIFEKYLVIRENSSDKREEQFRKLSIQKDPDSYSIYIPCFPTTLCWTFCDLCC